jgi:hypothetical protein
VQARFFKLEVPEDKCIEDYEREIDNKETYALLTSIFVTRSSLTSLFSRIIKPIRLRTYHAKNTFNLTAILKGNKFAQRYH